MTCSHRAGASSACGRILLLLAGWLLVSSSRVTAADAATTDVTDLTLEQLMQVQVTGASKFTQDASEAPASVTVIGQDDIKRFGYRTLAEILQSARGFYTVGDGAYTYAGVRGFSRPGDFNDRLLLLIDGHRTNENIYGSALLGNEEILDVDLIDHVEDSSAAPHRPFTGRMPSLVLLTSSLGGRGIFIMARRRLPPVASIARAAGSPSDTISPTGWKS